MFTLVHFAFWGCKHGAREEGALSYSILEHPVIFFKCLDKTLSDLFLINCVFLSTETSDGVSDLIYNLDRPVGFYCTWPVHLRGRDC